ncbi:hypothetical protein QJQ45_023591, partial [Haematococcus lacustris]
MCHVLEQVRCQGAVTPSISQKQQPQRQQAINSSPGQQPGAAAWSGSLERQLGVAAMRWYM